ncbi:hypothetical protein EAH79_14795 [Sphingomonas koreensis]|nr:hypothetical protein EAH79_14795 [Sphingomonas koreensis]
MVMPGWQRHTGSIPKDAICQRAAAGLVKAVASVFVSNKGGVTSEKQGHLIPKEFWRGSPLEQDWARGDFSSTWSDSEGWTIHAEAFGVTFARADIEPMAQSGETVGASRPAIAGDRSKGGRPPATDWEAVMIEMARQLYVGDLQPKALADVERAIAAHLAAHGISLSDSTIRDHARPLWRAIQREAGN